MEYKRAGTNPSAGDAGIASNSPGDLPKMATALFSSHQLIQSLRWIVTIFEAAGLLPMNELEDGLYTETV